MEHMFCHHTISLSYPTPKTNVSWLQIHFIPRGKAVRKERTWKAAEMLHTLTEYFRISSTHKSPSPLHITWFKFVHSTVRIEFGYYGSSLKDWNVLMIFWSTCNVYSKEEHWLFGSLELTCLSYRTKNLIFKARKLRQCSINKERCTWCS